MHPVPRAVDRVAPKRSSTKPSNAVDPEAVEADQRELVPVTPPEKDPTEHVYLSPTSAAVLQMGTSSTIALLCCGGAGVVSGVIAAVLFVLPGGILWSSLFLALAGCPSAVCSPAVGTVSGVTLRDWWGPERGTIAWPVIVAYAGEFLIAVPVLLFGTIAGALLTAPFFTSLIDFEGPTAPFARQEDLAWGSLGAGSALAIGAFTTGLVLAVLLPSAAATVTYGLGAESKGSEDTGFRWPGIFSPSRAESERLEVEHRQNREVPRRSTGASTTSMRH